jgi:hypothetical protein
MGILFVVGLLAALLGGLVAIAVIRLLRAAFPYMDRTHAYRRLDRELRLYREGRA